MLLDQVEICHVLPDGGNESLQKQKITSSKKLFSGAWQEGEGAVAPSFNLNGVANVKNSVYLSNGPRVLRCQVCYAVFKWWLAVEDQTKFPLIRKTHPVFGILVLTFQIGHSIESF